MSEQRSSRSRRRFLKLGGAAVVTGLAGCSGGNNGQKNDSSGNSSGSSSSGSGTSSSGGASSSNSSSGSSTTSGTTSGGKGSTELTVFHAGSLTAPFNDAAKPFEKKYGVQVNQESKGSVGSTKKITQEGRKADVLGVADYTLLRDMMMPKYAKWYAVFATNAMTIAYTDKSTGASKIGPDNWWKILSRDDVTVGHSDPDVDPNGYRSILSMKLGAKPFQGKTLYDESTAQKLIDNAKVPANTETSLIGQLQTGKLDYAWEYQSTSSTHDVKAVDLQSSVDLSKATSKYAKHYAKVQVKTSNGTIKGAPIAYGMTVPSNAPSPDLGAKWVEFMITGSGQKILKQDGFSPVSPAVVPESTKSAVPKNVMQNATAKSSLGPLKL